MRRHWLRRVAAFIVPRGSAVCMEPVALLDEAVASSALARRSSARTKQCHSSINKHYSAAHGCLMDANNRIHASMCGLGVNGGSTRPLGLRPIGSPNRANSACLVEFCRQYIAGHPMAGLTKRSSVASTDLGASKGGADVAVSEP